MIASGGTAPGPGGTSTSGGVPSFGGASSGGGTGGAGAGAGSGAGVCIPDATCSCASFNGHDYRFCPVVAVFDSALADCQSKGMSLVTVNDAAENAWIDTEAQARGLFAGRAPLLFLGGTDVAVPGEWRWPDGTLFWSGGAATGQYTNWSSPPGSSGISDCLGMQPDGTWVDRTCNSGNVTYACESL